MIKLIADSGSTKTDWRYILENEDIIQLKTNGINPFHLQEDDIYTIIKNELLPYIKTPPNEIFFYGAGCNDKKPKEKVGSIINKLFPRSRIEINTDRLGTARSLCGHEPGIACILGTGSNSCFFNGEKIEENIPPLGYILGDEGSGTHLGKSFLKKYLRGQVPQTIKEHFDRRYPTSNSEILEKIYSEPTPNTFIASFTKFLFDHTKNPFIFQLVYDNFLSFFENHVFYYEKYKDHKVHFSGSIAFYFSNILRQVANDNGLALKNILESPISGLTLYHTQNTA